MASSVDFTHRYHPHPRLSANQVAEYLTANATGRRRILREAKFPRTLMVIRYEDARGAVVAHLAGIETALDSAAIKLRRKADGGEATAYSIQNCELCIEAIESFQGSSANLEAGKTRFRRPELHNTKLKVSGVSVSVSLDLMTEETSRDGSRAIGAAILVFSKSMKSEEERAGRCRAIALLIHQLLKSQANTARLCDPALCMAIDVFNARIYRAKSQHKLLLRTVETSCDEVATVWPSVDPPADYNGPPILKVA